MRLGRIGRRRTRVLEVQVKLAVLRPVCYGRPGTDVGLESIEAERDDLCRQLAVLKAGEESSNLQYHRETNHS